MKLWAVPVKKSEVFESDECIDDELKKFKISYGSGEVSPHVRKGHWRHLIQKDGTVKKIWIEQTMIRADKLKKGGKLKGSVTQIRKTKKTSI